MGGLDRWPNGCPRDERRTHGAAGERERSFYRRSGRTRPDGRGECMLGTIRPTRTLFLIRHIRRNVSVAQNANAPTPIRDSLHDPPARDPPAKPVTRVRSSLHTLAPFAFVRFLMIFSWALLPPWLGSPTAARPGR